MSLNDLNNIKEYISRYQVLLNSNTSLNREIKLLNKTIDDLEKTHEIYLDKMSSNYVKFTIGIIFDLLLLIFLCSTSLFVIIEIIAILAVTVITSEAIYDSIYKHKLNKLKEMVNSKSNELNKNSIELEVLKSMIDEFSDSLNEEQDKAENITYEEAHEHVKEVELQDEQPTIKQPKNQSKVMTLKPIRPNKKENNNCK